MEIKIQPLTKKHALITSPYNNKLINILRKTPTRKYVGGQYNVINVEYLESFLDAVQYYGFDVRVEKEFFPVKIRVDKSISVNIDLGFIDDERVNRLAYLKRPRDGYALVKILRDEYGCMVEVFDESEEISIDLPSQPELYPYQEEALGFLRRRDYNGLLALEMGLGKTVVAISAIRELGLGPVLIVAPASLLYQWKKEIEELFGYSDACVLTSDLSMSRARSLFMKSDVIITNYEFLRKYNFSRVFELLILDECQRIKNWRTKVAQAISEVIAKRVIALSGTPIENNLLELYNIVDQVCPGYYGSLRGFKNRYIRKKGYSARYYNLDDVYAQLKGVMYRKRRCDVEVDLPELVVRDYRVTLSKKEMEVYHRILRDNIDEPLAGVANAKVFVSNPALRMDVRFSTKEVELLNLLDSFESEKVVVFSQYKRNIDRLNSLIDGRPCFCIHGSTRKRRRQEIIDEFLGSDNGVLVLTEVGNFGLNLQDVSVLVNFDLPWTYAKLEQRIGRIQRINAKGRKKVVFNFICKGTIDEHIDSIIYKKKELSDATVDGVKALLAKSVYYGISTR